MNISLEVLWGLGKLESVLRWKRKRCEHKSQVYYGSISHSTKTQTKASYPLKVRSLGYEPVLTNVNESSSDAETTIFLS